MIYIFYLIVLALLLYRESREGFKYNIFRAVLPIFYILFVGLRGQYVGVDTPVYYDSYYYFGPIGCDFVEEGFDFLNRFCYNLGWSHTPFFVVCAFVTIAPVAVAMFSMDRKEFTIMSMMFYTMSFPTMCNGMRQNMACGLFVGIVYWLSKKEKSNKKQFLIYGLVLWVASYFHVTALLLLPLYFLRYIKLHISFYVVFYLLSFFFIFMDVSDYIPILKIGNRNYGYHLESEHFIATPSFLGFTISTSVNLILFSLMYKVKAFKRFTLIANLVFLSFILKNFGFHIAVVGRLNMYFSWFVYALVAVIFNNYYKEDFVVKTVMRVMGIIYVALTLNAYISPQNMLYPYQFFGEEQIVKVRPE